MRVSLDIHAAQPFGERAKGKSASAILTDLAEHGSPHLPLVIIHEPSLARRAMKLRMRPLEAISGATWMNDFRR